MAGTGMGVDYPVTMDPVPARSPWFHRRLPSWIPKSLAVLAYGWGLLYLGLIALSAAIGDDPMFRWRFLLGPALSICLVAALPPYRGEPLRVRAHFVLLCAFIGPWIIHAAMLLSNAARPDDATLFGALAGPREEGLKLLGVLFLAWTTTKAKGWPTRLVLIGFTVGIMVSGLESAWSDHLPTLHPRGVFDRIASNAKHGLYTAIAVSGFSIARYLRARWRLLVPICTFALGAGAHAANNTLLKRAISRLVFAVDDLPTVVTSEQYFNAPHYDALHYTMVGAFVLILTLLLAALIALTFRLARRAGWSPQDVAAAGSR